MVKHLLVFQRHTIFMSVFENHKQQIDITSESIRQISKDIGSSKKKKGAKKF